MSRRRGAKEKDEKLTSKKSEADELDKLAKEMAEKRGNLVLWKSPFQTTSLFLTGFLNDSIRSCFFFLQFI